MAKKIVKCRRAGCSNPVKPGNKLCGSKCQIAEAKKWMRTQFHPKAPKKS